ncbi:NUDIX hydrolase [Frankia sp. AiPa1]|nr:NUDIX hydrolase [Frankia sp. AiPa1]
MRGRRLAFATPWLGVWFLDVEQPDGTASEYHVVQLRDLAVVAAVDDSDRVLMMWRHRIATDSWAWEFPMGLVEDGEDPQAAGARELEEETGWRPGSVRPLLYAEPASGITNARHFLFRADGCVRVAAPTEQNESDQISWIPLAELHGMINRREIVSSATISGALLLLLSSPTGVTPA